MEGRKRLHRHISFAHGTHPSLIYCWSHCILKTEGALALTESWVSEQLAIVLCVGGSFTKSKHVLHVWLSLTLSIMCRMSQSLFRNTGLQLYSLSCLYVPSPILNPTCHGNSLAQLKKKKIKEMKRKQVLQTACFYLKKLEGYIHFLTEKENAYRAVSDLSIFFFCPSISIYFLIWAILRINRAQRQKPP